MVFKRSIFIGALMILFLCCFHIMNQHYDELSRYQYANDENRKLILEYMTTDEINYLIDRQYKPEQFLNYLGLEGFDIHYVDWYNYAKTVEEMDDLEIIEVVNHIKNKMNYSTFKVVGEHYSISQLREFYVEENSFVHELSLISNPTLVRKQIESTKTLFTYIPKDLVEIDDVPIVNLLKNTESITIQEELVEPLKNMCKAAFDINEKTCGNMVITQGYVSYKEQEKIYQDGLLKYGIDDVLSYVSYPGQSIYQLGNVIQIVCAAVDAEVNEEEEVEISAQQLWLMEYASDYGFEFVNDPNQPLTEFILQFTGFEVNENEKGVVEE